ncbi:hypothetical protein PHMEG_00036935 [Phytophthora megakarya]|uniref:Uncharacterized protein n=1 Tax=Phytophthora megakarya TaxID=4795 RepID=A0A225UKE7_9STRA|nr:hypothetical protein PHMEG_00036935 [Phytophthora megakarya]
MMEFMQMEPTFSDGVQSLQTVQKSMKVAVTHIRMMCNTTNDKTFWRNTSESNRRSCSEEAAQSEGANKYDLDGTNTVHIQSHRRVLYASMRRQEKYCYAKSIFERVMEQLADMSSLDFFVALEN